MLIGDNKPEPSKQLCDCPFCGGAPTFDPGDNVLPAVARCIACGLSAKIETWNSRTNPAMPKTAPPELLHEIGNLLSFRSPSGHEIYQYIRSYLRENGTNKPTHPPK